MILNESPWFCGWRDANLTDEEFHRIQLELLRDPTTGVLLYGYAKNVTEDLTPEQLHRLGGVLRESLDDG